jgi:hypothetical protein
MGGTAGAKLVSLLRDVPKPSPRCGTSVKRCPSALTPPVHEEKSAGVWDEPASFLDSSNVADNGVVRHAAAVLLSHLFTGL